MYRLNTAMLRVFTESNGDLHSSAGGHGQQDAEVEFSGNNQRVRVKPVNWNESTLKVNAPGKDCLHRCLNCKT